MLYKLVIRKYETFSAARV